MGPIMRPSEKSATEHEPSFSTGWGHRKNRKTATGYTCTMAIDAGKHAVGQVPVRMHPLSFSSSPVLLRLTHAGGVNIVDRALQDDWCDPPKATYRWNFEIDAAHRMSRSHVGGSTSAVRWDEKSRGRIFASSDEKDCDGERCTPCSTEPTTIQPPEKLTCRLAPRCAPTCPVCLCPSRLQGTRLWRTAVE